MPAAGMLARCCPWGSDVQDNLKSLPLCALASCHRFCPWLFWEHGGAAAPRHAFLASATRGSCQELPREERWAQRREMSPVDIPIPHPALCCPCLTPSLCPGLLPTLPGAASTQPGSGLSKHSGQETCGGKEEGAATLQPCFKALCNEEELQMGL